MKSNHTKKTERRNTNEGLPAVIKTKNKKGDQVSDEKIRKSTHTPYERAMWRSQRFLNKASEYLCSVSGKPATRDVVNSLSGAANAGPEMNWANQQLRRSLVMKAAASLAEVQAQQESSDFYLVEIEDGRSATSFGQPSLDLMTFHKFAWKAMARASTNFLALIVPTLDPEGLAQDRLHAAQFTMRAIGIAYGEGIAERPEDMASKMGGLLAPPIGGGPTIRVTLLDKGVAPILNALAPVAALISSGLSQASIAAKRRTREAEHKGDPLDLGRALWFRVLSMIDMKKTMLAGGQGKAIKKEMMQQAQAWLKAQRSGAPPVHPEGVLQFWSELLPVMEGSRFPLPLIAYRHPIVRATRPTEEPRAKPRKKKSRKRKLLRQPAGKHKLL